MAARYALAPACPTLEYSAAPARKRSARTMASTVTAAC
jgi:hypothetical protein